MKASRASSSVDNRVTARTASGLVSEVMFPTSFAAAVLGNLSDDRSKRIGIQCALF